MSIEKEITQVEAQIRRLKIEYEKFFNGALPIPPEPFREEVARSLKRLRSGGRKTSVDRFRLTNLEANFNSINELLSRRVRNHEMGAGSSKPRSEPTPRFDVSKGVRIGRDTDERAATELYQGLYGERGSTSTDLGAFQQYLSTQVKRLQEKTGCSEVQFRVAREDGKVKLKARPITTDS